MWKEQFLVSGFLGMNLGSDGKDTRGWVGGGGGAAVEESGHLSHLEFCTDRPPSPALITKLILGLLSGRRVGHWTSKLSLWVHLFPQEFQEVGGIGGHNQPSF